MLDKFQPVCLYTDVLVKSPHDIGKYYSGCEWAPDGTCLMTSSSDNILNIYDTPPVIDDDGLVEQNPVTYEWKPSVVIPHSEPIYDFQWYPLMKSTEPATCFLATSCRDQPIQLVDAYCGKKRHSFLCHDVNQCITSPISLQFTPDGCSLVGGFKKHIRFFDLTKLKAAGEMSTTQNKNSLNSLISTIAFCKETFQSNGLVACGSYDSKVAIYDYYSGNCAMFFDLKKDIANLSTTSTNTNNNNVTINNGGGDSGSGSGSSTCGGVTKIVWSSDGNIVTCGTRQCDWIIQYDIRAASGGGSGDQRPLALFKRPIKNNQKFGFSFDHANNCMLSGGMDGNLSVWNMQNPQFINAPTVQIPLHDGPFTGCALHPHSKRLLSTVSGCRIFDYPGDVFIDKQNDQFFLPDARLCLWYLGDYS